jgi:hypothetical protein
MPAMTSQEPAPSLFESMSVKEEVKQPEQKSNELLDLFNN